MFDLNTLIGSTTEAILVAGNCRSARTHTSLERSFARARLARWCDPDIGRPCGLRQNR
jgi:hypothetical protein